MTRIVSSESGVPEGATNRVGASTCSDSRFFPRTLLRLRGDDQSCLLLPFPLCRASPVLQRRPHAAAQLEAVDRGRGAQRFEAVEFDADPLEAAFLQDVARGGIGDAGAGEQLLDLEFLEGEVDHRARGLGAKTPAPMLHPEPVAELGRLRFAPVDADHAYGCAAALDQENRVANLLRHRAHEFNGMLLEIGMRYPAKVDGDAKIADESSNCFY